MMTLIREGGFMMYFILAGAILAAVSTVRGIAGLRRGTGRSKVDGIIFWGGFALVVGVLGTLIGFSQIAYAVEAAGDVAPSLLWGGIRVALITTITGCATFVLALSAWAPLRWLASKREPTGDGRIAVLEQELQAIRGELDNLAERTAFYEKLRTSR